MNIDKKIRNLSFAMEGLGLFDLTDRLMKLASGPAKLPERIIKDFSILAANNILKYIVGESDSPVILSSVTSLTSFSGKEVKVLVYVEITEGIDEQNFAKTTEKELGYSDSEELIGLIRIFIPISKISEEEGESDSLESLKNQLFWMIHSSISHEMTHALDELHSESSPSYQKFKRLNDDSGPASSFYFTTREEVKAYISDIISELKSLFAPDDISSMSFREIISYSNTYAAISKELEVMPGDEDTRTIGGSLARRKRTASKKINSALYKWFLDSKTKEEDARNQDE